MTICYFFLLDLWQSMWCRTTHAWQNYVRCNIWHNGYNFLWNLNLYCNLIWGNAVYGTSYYNHCIVSYLLYRCNSSAHDVVKKTLCELSSKSKVRVPTCLKVWLENFEDSNFKTQIWRRDFQDANCRIQHWKKYLREANLPLLWGNFWVK